MTKPSYPRRLSRGEFDGWLRSHCDIFPSVGVWLRERGTTAMAAVVDAWYAALDHYNAFDLEDATRAFLDGRARHPSVERMEQLPGLLCEVMPFRQAPLEKLQLRGTCR